MKKLSMWQLRVGILLVLAVFMALGASSGLAGAKGDPSVGSSSAAS